jgi:hypothetical protein
MTKQASVDMKTVKYNSMTPRENAMDYTAKDHRPSDQTKVMLITSRFYDAQSLKLVITEIPRFTESLPST